MEENLNIYFEYNKDKKEFVDKVNSIKKYIEEYENLNKIKILSRITSKSKCDIHVIISNELTEIYKYCKNIKDKNKILVITSNIDAAHVLGCIEVTFNLTYLKKDDEYIVKRLNEIYSKNKE